MFLSCRTNYSRNYTLAFLVKIFIYSEISIFRGVHEICTQYVYKKMDFAIVFTEAKAIEDFQAKFAVPIALFEAVASYRLYKLSIIYNSVWALAEETQRCLIEPQFSDDKKPLTVSFCWYSDATPPPF